MHRASVVLVALLALAGCKHKTVKTAKTASSPSSRQAPGAEIALPPVGGDDAGAPLAGTDGSDALGFPTQHVDRVVLRTMLAHKQYNELTKVFEDLQSSFELDPTRETWPMDAGDAFSSAEPAILPALDAWVAATPDSFAPYLARATHWVDTAHARRGSRTIKETPAADIELMTDAFAHAKADLDRGLTLRPKLVAAQRLRIVMARHEGNAKLAEGTISAALAACPSCYRVRVTYIVNSVPRWGGSYADLATFVRRSQTSGPLMKLLPGFIDLGHAEDFSDAKKLEPALAALDHACSLGERWEFLSERGEVQSRLGDKDKGLADIEHAATLCPGNPDIFASRADAHYGLKHYELAGKDLRSVFQLEPTNEKAKRLLPYEIDALLWEADQHKKAGRRVDAIRVLDLAAELAPGDRRVTGNRAWAILGDAGSPDAIDQLEAAAKAAPDDFAAHQQLDYALAKQRRFPRVVEMWSEYLGAHPNDAHAYYERGGAYFNLGKRAEALADARKACDLGLSEACAQVKQHP